jgi:hypothetical protein
VALRYVAASSSALFRVSYGDPIIAATTREPHRTAAATAKLITRTITLFFIALASYECFSKPNITQGDYARLTERLRFAYDYSSIPQTGSLDKFSRLW